MIADLVPARGLHRGDGQRNGKRSLTDLSTVLALPAISYVRFLWPFVFRTVRRKTSKVTQNKTPYLNYCDQFEP